ncbi:IS3 family transposase [uncultured Bifidobacterium sp.]|uniref:IS3 family transposase n=1 Tax=uncultured Bifidobacterium sp. TaxID=165187 RepID=UPI002596B3ED|nr:IS3 family transposase [uncultured Bifidobacterium sp.]
MREDRRRRYDDGFRREALELIKSGAGKDTLARRLAIPVYTARNWIGLYRSNGEEAVMGGGGSRRYDWETKVAAARDYVENGLTKTEAMASKEIVAWDVSRSPDLGQQKRLPAMLAERLPAGAEPILHSDMGEWQYQHQWWRKELERLGIRQSMSRKGNCLDNAAAEQVFGHLKDEFYRGRVFDSYEQFKRELDAYIIHWNTRRRQIRLEGRTPEEFRSMSLAV